MKVLVYDHICCHTNSGFQNAHYTFTVVVLVGVGAVVVCDQDVYATETGTPICRGGATLFEASPVTAFVCSPQTTRFITREEGNALSTMPAESGEGNVLHDARCRSISPISRLSARAASLVTEDVSRTLFDAYTYSPTPVVLTSSPHSLSVSSIRPIVLYM